MTTATEVEDPQLRDKATRIAELMVKQAFDGRIGHGGRGNPIVYRTLTREQLQTYLICAFEYGSRWESNR